MARHRLAELEGIGRGTVGAIRRGGDIEAALNADGAVFVATIVVTAAGVRNAVKWAQKHRLGGYLKADDLGALVIDAASSGALRVEELLVSDSYVDAIHGGSPS